MKRRSFLVSSLQASSLASGRRPAEERARESAVIGSAATPEMLMGPAAVEHYFSDAKLHQVLGTDQLKKPGNVQVVTYNFPSWHPSPFMEARFGKGWTEFDTLRNARSLFPGHSMPHFPLWGYYNEADPEWAAKEIDLAATYGVDAWMIDWYWHKGTQFYQEQLEQGFLQAPNRSKLKFAVMWANHDWKNVYPARSPQEAGTLIPQLHDEKDCGEVANYCCEHYFSQRNYLRIGDAPVFAIFDAGKIVEQLGEGGCRRSLDLMRERAHKLGFPKLHLQVCNGYSPAPGRLRELGFDSATMYGTFGWTYGSKPAGSRLPYGLGASEAVGAWQVNKKKLPVPFYPACSVGWDDSPRFGEYASIAINRSPDQFERLVRAARHFVASQEDPKLIYIAAWNEWTEDHVLLPDSYWGYSYLEALRRAVRA